MKIVYLGVDNLSCKGIFYILELSFPQDEVTFINARIEFNPSIFNGCDIVILDNEAIDSYLNVITDTFKNTNLPVMILSVDNSQLKRLHREIPGTKGMVNRNGNADFLIKAINLIADGGYCYSWDVIDSQAIVDDVANEDVYEKAGLTRREREILELCLAGETNKAISVRLSRSEKTISSHKSNILKKLGIKSSRLKNCFSENNGFSSIIYSPPPKIKSFTA